MSNPLTSSPPEPLQEEFFLTDAALLRRWFPWLHIPSSLRMAFDPRKIALSMLALVLLSLPNLLRSWSLEEKAPVHLDRPFPWERGYLYQDVPVPQPHADQILADPWSAIRMAVSQGPQTFTPLTQVLQQGQQLIESKFHWKESSIHLIELLWTWFIWAVVGTILCRLTALDFMGRDVGWGEAWRYCRKRVVSAFASPLLPMIGIAAFWLPCVFAGWVSRMPGLGEPLIAGCWFFLWLCGAVLALLLMGLTFCWPLMIATVGVEGTDAFDGLSRSYNYLFSRPWYVVWMSCVILFIGGCTLFGVRWLAGQAEYLTLMSFGSGASPSTLDTFQAVKPVDPVFTHNLLQFSRGIITLAVNAFAHSFFWVAATVMFLLLRQSVDATPLDQLTEDRQSTLGELPIVGMAAVERREQEATIRTGE